MIIFNELNSQKNIALALGFFDGVHIAHQKVISECVAYAEKNGLKPAVITFKEHPCISLKALTPQYISTTKDRIEKIKDLGIEYLYLLDFSSNISQQTSEEFIETLNKTISPKAIFTGYNFFFGKNKSGNTQTLKNLSTKYNFQYFEIPEQKINDLIISSTNVRNCLKEGNIQKANKLLGYNFCFAEKVVQGNKLGREINFPTANINYPKELVSLKYGVYSVKIKIENTYYKGIMNYGIKPTILTSNNLSCEIHIFDFNQNIYSKKIQIIPEKYLREEKKFDSLDKLKNQILLDIKNIYNN